MSARSGDIVIIGAGPYGLATAARLRGAGADVRVFGSPMSFWKRHMPKGMWLRSPWAASHIGDPRSDLSLEQFQRERGTPIKRPVPLADFVEYGRWVQQHAVPDVDERRVDEVEGVASGFRLTLEDGERIECGRVVVAAGIADFAWTPPEFGGLDPDLASHSSAHQDLARFAKARVAVVGGGQSAFESAVLLHESGADVELIMRAPNIHWVGRAPRKGLVGRLLFDRTDVGPAGMSHVIARPQVLRRLPASMQREAMRRALAPGASTWLRPRSAGMRVTTGRVIREIATANGLVLKLDDGTTRSVEHAVFATGYRVDLRRYRFLAPSLLARVRSVDGYPILGAGLESSVPGLHFLGAPAARSFGPLVRFVAGTQFASAAVARAVIAARAARTRQLGEPQTVMAP
jgi:cation diffusion facilitator CzcD-associated flavoprotein CzcO